MTSRKTDIKDVISSRPAGAAIRVRGLVQGVGFRPAVWQLARGCGLTGDVLNDGEGVLIRVFGRSEVIREFLERLPREAPPLARIDTIEQSPLNGPPPPGFSIVDSENSAVTTGIVPDAATCPDCLAEVLDAADRRHRYAFTNCTHCGPRLSIIRALPYDRAQTSMAAFPMCPACQAEYGDPANRRFHAQPNACPECGPRAWVEEASPHPAPGDMEAIAHAARLIASGAIVAIKGIGGFHLACDAASAGTVERLRQRKHRYGKPLALMALDTAMVRGYARLSPEEETLLTSRAAPIVVLDRLPDGLPLAPALAPGQTCLGFMLPYTPLHHLLMRAVDRPIVLTSGNRSEEPQCIANDDARERLGGIADAWLMHDRDIVNRLDDSVVRVAAGAPRMIRRARGFAPAPLKLPPGFETAAPVLAMGGALKSAFCLLRGGEAILSQHIGDLDDTATHTDYRRALALYRDLFQFAPAAAAVDLHPDYPSTVWGATLAEAEGLPLLHIQHHHAHVAAAMAEHRWPIDAGPVLGVVLDGMGLGDDGTIWGGEFLSAGYRGYRRLAHFAPVPMPGGDAAAREPWRNAYAHLSRAIGWEAVTADFGDVPIVQYLSTKQCGVLDAMMARRLNAPLASSAGRLFDAVAAAVGVCRERVSYEGQAAIELEALASGAMDDANAFPYPFAVEDGPVLRLGFVPLWWAVLNDLAGGVPPELIAARFHKGLAAAVARLARGLARAEGSQTVALTGGVFQNRLLLEATGAELARAGLRVLIPSDVPANDGGIALGQAAIAAARQAGE